MEKEWKRIMLIMKEAMLQGMENYEEGYEG